MIHDKRLLSLKDKQLEQAREIKRKEEESRKVNKKERTKRVKKGRKVIKRKTKLHLN